MKLAYGYYTKQLRYIMTVTIGFIDQTDIINVVRYLQCILTEVVLFFDKLAEWSKALRSGRSPKGVGSNPTFVNFKILHIECL